MFTKIWPAGCVWLASSTLLIWAAGWCQGAIIISPVSTSILPAPHQFVSVTMSGTAGERSEGFRVVINLTHPSPPELKITRIDLLGGTDPLATIGLPDAPATVFANKGVTRHQTYLDFPFRPTNYGLISFLPQLGTLTDGLVATVEIDATGVPPGYYPLLLSEDGYRSGYGPSSTILESGIIHVLPEPGTLTLGLMMVVILGKRRRWL